MEGGPRGVVGSVQDAAAAVLAIVAATTAATGRWHRAVVEATACRLRGPDVFLTVVAATMVVTLLLTGVTFALLGVFRLGNLVRFVPYPVVGGFLAGTGWLLFKGGIDVAAGVQLVPAHDRRPAARGRARCDGSRRSRSA